MNEGAPLPQPNKTLPAKLFLETSAQILRLQGQPEIKGQIVDLIAQVQRNSACLVGTSVHVKREFDAVYEKFFNELEGRIASLTNPALERPFENLWHEVLGLMAQSYTGGHSLLDDLTIMFMGRYAGRRVPPTFLQSIVTAIKADLSENFLRGDFFDFDKSTCQVWETRGRCFKCKPEPDEACKLRLITVDNRANFLASGATIRDARPRRKESKWFQKNLDRLHGLEGKALHEFLGKHPNPTGDPVIFWEVPDGWTILSRDTTFQILRDAHRKELGFYMVRLPRTICDHACKVRAVDANGDVDARLISYNSNGARVRSENFKPTEGQAVLVTAPQLGSTRYGKISKKDESLPGTFGVKFILKRSSP